MPISALLIGDHEIGRTLLEYRNVRMIIGTMI